jgi:starvation-inducible DNA-binding protein
MPKKQNRRSVSYRVSAQPRPRQSAREIQRYGTVNYLSPLGLEEPVRLEMTEQLNRLLADAMTLRDLYKKSHWQTTGPTFYQLHLLFDKHYGEQVELVDSIAERIQLLGGVSIAMAGHVAETTDIDLPPRGREEVPVQLWRLLDAHEIIIGKTRKLARRAAQLGDDGTNDLLVSEVLRTSEMQVWFLREHLVDAPLVEVSRPSQVPRVA